MDLLIWAGSVRIKAHGSCADQDYMRANAAETGKPSAKGLRLVAAVTAVAFLLLATSVFAKSVTGRTAQGTAVAATIRNGKVTFITMQVHARCTNGASVTEGPGFNVPFAHPQDHLGRFGDSYANLQGTMRLAGQRLSASFTATIHKGKIVGTVRASSVVIASGVTCSTSGPVAFHTP